MIDLYEEISENSRRKILLALYDGPKNVTALVETTKLKQPNVSNHLSRLKGKEIVRAVKYGREVIYSLYGTEVERLVSSLLVSSTREEIELDFEELSLAFARAATTGDEFECTAIFEKVFRAHVPILDLYEHLVGPAMSHIGTWWKVAAINEAQEHMATAIMERLLAKTLQVFGQAPRTGRTVLSGCGPGNHHVLGVTVVTDYLRFSGWRTFALGGNVPTAAFISSIKQYDPDLVITQCQSQVSIPGTLEFLKEINQSRLQGGTFKIAIGGGMVAEQPEIFLEAGADYAVRSLREFAEIVVPELEKPTRVRGKSSTRIG